VARLADVATGVALIVVDQRAENQIAVASGANAALDGAYVAAALERLEGGVVLLSLEVGDAALLAGARGARLAVLNPAPAREVPAALLDAGPLLTPNAGEARDLTGEEDPRAAALALRERTGAPVVVTLGADGALLADGPGDPVRVPAPRVDAVDTTGAGDCLNGALAAELARGAALEAAVAFAVRAAALSTLRQARGEGMPSREAVDAAGWRATPPGAGRGPTPPRRDATPPGARPRPYAAAPRCYAARRPAEALRRHAEMLTPQPRAAASVAGARAARARGRAVIAVGEVHARLGDDPDERLDEPAVELRARHAAQLRDGVLDGDRRAVGVARCHHVERVADG
jgi:ribokinase